MNPNSHFQSNQIQKEIQEAIITQTTLMGEPPPDMKGRLDIVRNALLHNKVPKGASGVLTLLEEEKTGEFHELKDAALIGTDPECDMQIQGEYISRTHCIIELKEGNWFVRDLDSTNGIYVNGIRVVQHHLRDGDIIQLGKTMMLFFGKNEVPE